MISSAESVDIIAHMNSDHADAVLLIARVLAQKPEANMAVMTGITSDAIQLQVDSNGHTESVSIAFDQPVDTSQDARRVLIKMTRTARENDQPIKAKSNKPK